MLSEITSTHSIFSWIYQSLLCQGENLKEQGIAVPFHSKKLNVNEETTLLPIC